VIPILNGEKLNLIYVKCNMIQILFCLFWIVYMKVVGCFDKIHIIEDICTLVYLFLLCLICYSLFKKLI